MLLQHIGNIRFLFVCLFVSVNIVINNMIGLKKFNIVINYWEYLVLNIVINC